MKKLISSIVAVLAVLSYSAVASAIPLGDNPSRAISVLENEHHGATAKPAKKHKKVRKSHKGRKAAGKKEVPASSSAPASSVSPNSSGSAPAGK